MTRRRLSSLLAALAICFLPTTQAHAEVTEPNGAVVPVDSGGETQLSELFLTRGESIDFIADGRSTPETFSPLCGFSATFVLKQSQSSIGVGWYNADPALTVAPSAADVYQILPPGSAVGTVVTGADIRTDPNYAGGPIGFALQRSPLYFTEARYNPVCTGCAMPGPWILSVSYASTEVNNAFYVAFEDGRATADSWNNDGDFNDYVFYFEGLSCVGEGDACEVEGAKGVCLPGVQECNTEGTLVCRSSNQPTEERCDGLDNDCDGSSDEGDSLCDMGSVCSRGRCVPPCGDLEFRCAAPPYTACENGLCVEPACVGKTCDDGQACVGGECRAPCDGVSCPAGQACRLGVCADPCEGVSCSDDRVCSGGACILRCDCTGCGTGLACQASSGLCVDEGCDSQTCGEGEVCQAGQCVDACAQASCPVGSECVSGQCSPVEADAGIGMGSGGALASGGSSSGAGGSLPGGGSTTSGGDGPSTGGGGGTEAAGTGGSGRSEEGEDDASGCGCRVAGARHDPAQGPSAWLLLPVAILAFRRRRP